MIEARTHQFSKLRNRPNYAAWPYRLRVVDAWGVTIRQRQFCESLRWGRAATRLEKRLPAGGRLVREKWNEETKAWERIIPNQ